MEYLASQTSAPEDKRQLREDIGWIDRELITGLLVPAARVWQPKDFAEQVMTRCANLGLKASDRAVYLDRLGLVAVHVGLNLAPGQELLITAPLDAVELVRRVTEHAYKAGAALVTTFFSDDISKLLRFRYGSDCSFDRAATWLGDAVANALRSNTARLSIFGEDPILLADQDPLRISRANAANAHANRAVLELLTRSFAVNWAVIASPTPAWARVVFPNEQDDVALSLLWQAVAAASRVCSPDPVAEWQSHAQGLRARANALTARNYTGLHLRGPGTDLTVGFAEGYRWVGGAGTAANGITCVPNIPTEEVAVTPHRDRVDGYVCSTRPLLYQGVLINDISVTFEKGRVVEAGAGRGGAMLDRLLSIDEGACHLGEVALVPHASPISQTGLLFQNTLFDENAASHVAFGQSFSCCLRDGRQLDARALAERGANASLIHVDWMIGSHRIDVDGVTEAGEREPLMRAGEWVAAPPHL